MNTARPIVTYVCEVKRVSPLSATTFQIDLQSPAGTVLNYHAGQYLQLELDLNNNGQPQSLMYSIANSFNPEHPRRLQLFIQQSSEFSAKVLQHLIEKSISRAFVQLKLPMGRAFLQTDLTRRHVLVAAGSGISKIKCISEEIVKQQPNANVSIYWSNKNRHDFYLLNEFERRANQYKNLTFTPIVESADKHWHGRTGYLYEVIKEDFEHLHNTQFYLCGSPSMVYGTIDQLKPCGLAEKNCYSDAFEFSPRLQAMAV